MRINNILIHNTNNIYKTDRFNFCGNLNNPSNPLNRESDCDLPAFILLSNQYNNYSVAKTPQQKRIEQLYNETFEQAMSLMPHEIQELDIEKPRLFFSQKNKLHSGTHATYDFVNNSIKIYEQMESDDFYICYKEDENGLLTMFPTVIIGEEQLEKMGIVQGTHTIKLSTEERNLYIKSVIAHEIRHCIQEHVLASCKSTRNQTNKMYSDLQTRFSRIFESDITKMQVLLRHFKSPEIQDKAQRYIEYYQKCSQDMGNMYWKKYKPKKMLDGDFALKFSILDDDNRYFSAKKHFLPAKRNIPKDNSEGKTRYYSNPFEIDAFNFQFEFLLWMQMQSDTTREDVTDLIAANIMDLVKIGTDNLEKCGYESFVTKQ